MHIRINGGCKKTEAEMRWAQLMNLEDSIIVVDNEALLQCVKLNSVA